MKKLIQILALSLYRLVKGYLFFSKDSRMQLSLAWEIILRKYYISPKGEYPSVCFIHEQTLKIYRFPSWEMARESDVTTQKIWEYRALKEYVRHTHLHSAEEIKHAKHLLRQFSFFRQVFNQLF